MRCLFVFCLPKMELFLLLLVIFSIKNLVGWGKTCTFAAGFNSTITKNQIKVHEKKHDSSGPLQGCSIAKSKLCNSNSGSL